MFTAKRPIAAFARRSKVRLNSIMRRGLTTTTTTTTSVVPKSILQNEKLVAGTLLSVAFATSIWAFKPLDLSQQEAKLSVPDLGTGWDTFNSKSVRMTDDDDDDDEDEEEEDAGDDDDDNEDEEEDENGDDDTVYVTDIDSEFEDEQKRRAREHTPMPKEEGIEHSSKLVEEEDEDDEDDENGDDDTVYVTDIDSEFEDYQKRRVREHTPMPKEEEIEHSSKLEEDDDDDEDDENDDDDDTVYVTDIDSEFEDEQKRRARECIPMPK